MHDEDNEGRTTSPPGLPGLPPPRPGGRLDHYRILELLARGGMGEVYVAHDETLGRKVALKAIRGSHLADPHSKRRFLEEARILSRLEHPGICQVYDFLESEGGDFIVLELIEGETLSRVLESTMGIRQRVDLALGIVDALVAAHRQGVVHRDLKPSNVMVTPDGRVKILDFGLARSLPEEAATQALSSLQDEDSPPSAGASTTLRSSGLDESLQRHTETGSVIGTPGYMSPEQARSEATGPASDMYSFGLLLRELLSGRRLHPKGSDPYAIYLKSLKAEVPEVEGLPKVLQALVDDLARVEPASRPSAPEARARLAAYLERPRRRLVLGAAFAAAALVLLGIFGLVKYAIDVTQAREASDLARRQAEQLADFLVELFEEGEPGRPSDRDLTVREVLDDGVHQLERRLMDQPAVRARLLDAIGRVYLGLGAPEPAAPLLEEAARLRTEVFGDHHPETAASLESLIRLRTSEGRQDDREALARRALAIREKALDPRDPAVAESLRSLAWALIRQDRFEEARPLLERSLSIRKETLDLNDPELARGYFDLGALHWYMGDYGPAETLLQRSLALGEVSLGPDHSRLTQVLTALGGLYWKVGQHAEAEELFGRSLEILEATTGPSNLRVAEALSNLGILTAELGRPGEAVEKLERALELKVQAVGRNSQESAGTMATLAWALHQAGDLERSEVLFREALAIQEQTVGSDHSRVATFLTDLGRLLIDRDEGMAAREVLERGLAIRESAFGPDHLQVADTLTALADLERRIGRREDEARLLRRALDIRTRALGVGHASLAELETLLEEALRAGQDRSLRADQG